MGIRSLKSSALKVPKLVVKVAIFRGPVVVVVVVVVVVSDPDMIVAVRYNQDLLVVNTQDKTTVQCIKKMNSTRLHLLLRLPKYDLEINFSSNIFPGGQVSVVGNDGPKV